MPPPNPKTDVNRLEPALRQLRRSDILASLEQELADLALLTEKDFAYRDLMTEVAGHVKTFRANWKAQPRKGRPRVTSNDARRQVLIVAIATAFQQHSGFDQPRPTQEYRQDYRDSLTKFIGVALLRHGVRFPPERLRRLIPTAQRVPRSTKAYRALSR